ncbi:anthranilate synthase component I family protein [Ruicaihuangia caeni]|uniref:anthranilate synthase component I family protein n=1 Tax=Ruicaihuangia caeni TaxID=3042517 RepID=UPI0033905CC3
MRPPLLAWEVTGGIDSAALFEAIAEAHDDVFWLDSGPDAAVGRSVLGWSADRYVSTEPNASDFAALRERLRRVPRAEDVSDTALHVPGLPLGWVGWLGYELRAVTMGEPQRHALRHPPLALLWVDRAVVVDHESGRVSLVAIGHGWDAELVQWRAEMLEHIEASRSNTRAVPQVLTNSSARSLVQWRHSDAEYLDLIEQCRAAIRAGDAYLLCLTNEATVDGHFDAVARYLALRQASPAHHGGFVRIGGVSLLSASPEQFLLVTADGSVETHPIKGTRRRGATALEDERLHRELRDSEKERAENLMIVDLMRNDLQRVCRIGSVEVPRLLAIESYAQVHQLVSRVRGRLAEGLDAIDVVMACLPGGSMTGAPKLSATRILDRLEDGPRGIYSGAFGYLGADGSADLAMVIRSIVIDAAGATVGAGGGITALSDAAAELEEVKIKAAPLLASLGVARH